MSSQNTPSFAKNLMFVERESSLFKFIKPAIVITSCFFAMSSLAQTNTNVKLNGNTATAGDFIGTTNNENLVIKTNGQNHTIFQKDGDLKVVGLQGAINRLLYTNANGVIKPLAEGTAGQVLMGDLTWGTMPTSYWNINANGNKLSTTINKVGINTNNPAFNLDVNGDGHFSGNLVLNGELIINEKITSPKQLTTAKVVADSIMMGAGKALYGETTIKGDVKLKYRLDVTGDAVFNGNQQVVGSQSILGNQFLQGSQDVNGTLTARQGLLFASGKGIKETVLVNGTAVYTYGKGSGGGADPVLPTLPCFNPVTYPSAFVDHQMPGVVQIYPADASGNYISNGSVLNMQSWETVSSIDVAGGNGLLIDYFCGKDVAICTGENATSSNSRGGVVRMGHNVMIGGPWPPDNYDVALNINGSEQTGLFVKSVNTTNPYNYGVVSSVNGLNNKAFAVLLQNTNNDKEIISLRGNGEAFFGALTSTVKPTLYVSPSINANNQLGTGRVGIGTETPATALDVKGDVTVSNLGDGVNTRTLLVNSNGQLVPGTISSTTSTAWSLGGNNITNPSVEWFGTSAGSSQPLDFYTNGIRRMRLDENGHLVIGYPYGGGAETEMMHINAFNQKGFILINSSTYDGSGTKNSGVIISNDQGNIVLKQDVGSVSRLGWITGPASAPVFSSYMSFRGESILIGTPDANFEAGNTNTQNTKLVISTTTQNGYTPLPFKIVNSNFMSHNQGTVFEVMPDGTTHIGNTKPNNLPYSNAKLSVDGSIIAKEIFVRDQTGANWADYVFAKDYKLMPLIEVEKYVTENKHLPNVPSAKEIDEKGQGIGALQIVQMEKIEELYLHMIELNKKLEKLEKENEELKAKIKE